MINFFKTILNIPITPLEARKQHDKLVAENERKIALYDASIIKGFNSEKKEHLNSINSIFRDSLNNPGYCPFPSPDFAILHSYFLNIDKRYRTAVRDFIIEDFRSRGFEIKEKDDRYEICF